MESTFCIIIAVLTVNINGQTPQSPCPKIFDYEGDGDNVHGVIHVTLKSQVTSVQIKIQFTLVASLYSVSFKLFITKQIIIII